MSTITDIFKEITHYDISKFLSDFIYFTKTYYGSIVNYYNGSDINGEAFAFFDDLKIESESIESLFELYGEQFNLVDFWELMDRFGDIQVKLSTIDNLGRWQRSSRKTQYDAFIKLDYVQKQNETLEIIAKKAGYVDFDNDWVRLSIENDLNEEKYTSTGGTMMTVALSNRMNFQLRNIVDNLSPLNLYGKDIQKKFEILDGDLVTLSGEPSLMQTFDTIFQTMKGSMPEFPEVGTDPNMVGANVNGINYPSIFKNILNMFQRDDRFRSIDLVDLYRDEDQIYMKIQAKTKIGDILQNDVLL